MRGRTAAVVVAARKRRVESVEGIVLDWTEVVRWGGKRGEVR